MLLSKFSLRNLLSFMIVSLLVGCAVDHTVFTGASIRQEGQGDVVIVLEAGAGDGPSSWAALRKELAPYATVISYDRPRWLQTQVTGKEVAENLQQLLQQKQLKGPLILVGHSIGGPFVLSYALQYPEQIQGIVLVDGRPIGFKEACQQAQGQLCDIPQLLKLALPLWVTAEINGIAQTYQQHQSYAGLPDVPVVVFSATKPPLLSDEIFMRVWLQKQQELAARFPQGQFIAVPDTGHYIHQEKPEVILAAIKQILASINKSEQQSKLKSIR